MMKTLLLLPFLLCSLAVIGQDTIGIPSENVEVIKRYQAAILQSTRKDITFEKKETTKKPINYSYNITGEKVIDFERPAPEIRPLGYEGEPVSQQKLKNGYLYGGYGTHNTINAGAAYHYFIEDWIEAGFKVDHFSARGDTLYQYDETLNPELQQLKFSNTEANVYVGYHLGSQTIVKLNGDLQLDRHVLNPTTSGLLLDTASTLPVNTFGGGLTLDHNTFEENGFALRIGGAYHVTHQNLAEISDKVLKGELNILKTLSDNLSAELPVNYFRTLLGKGYELEDRITSYNDFILRPNLRFKGQNYTAKVGVEYINGLDDNYIFPIVDLSMDRIISIFDLRLYTSSEYSRNSLSQVMAVQPYLNLPLYEAGYRRDYNFEPSVTYKKFDFGLNISYRTYENDYNYRGLSDTGLFEINLLDREELAFTPRVGYNPSDKITLEFSVAYTSFLSNENEVTYRPKWLTSLSSEQFLLNRKLKFSQELKIVGQRLHIDNRPDPIQFYYTDLNSFVDLALGVRYKISDSFDVYVQGTNLLPSGESLLQNSENPYAVVWQNYPILRQQVWAGLKFRM